MFMSVAQDKIIMKQIHKQQYICNSIFYVLLKQIHKQRNNGSFLCSGGLLPTTLPFSVCGKIYNLFCWVFSILLRRIYNLLPNLFFWALFLLSHYIYNLPPNLLFRVLSSLLWKQYIYNLLPNLFFWVLSPLFWNIPSFMIYPQFLIQSWINFTLQYKGCVCVCVWEHPGDTEDSFNSAKDTCVPL